MGNQSGLDKNAVNKPKEDIKPKNKVLSLIQNLWNIRFVRFIIIGALNTLFSYALYSFLLFVGMDYRLAKIISTILGIIFNFFTTGRIVFENKDNALIFRFILVYAFTMTLDVLFLKRLVAGLNINEYLAGALTTIPIALLSFFLNSVFTFKTISLSKKTPKDTS